MKKLKHRGDMGIGSMMIIILTIFISLVLILSYASWHTKLAVRDKIILTVSSYLRSVEVEGYLSDEQKKQITKELQEIGMEEISFEGTTFTPVGYGEKVYLHVSGKLHLKNTPDLVIENNNISFTQESDIYVDIKREGLSFY